MEIVFERCAGLDVHKATVVACVRQPGEGKRQRRGEVRTFSTVTRGLSSADYSSSAIRSLSRKPPDMY